MLLNKVREAWPSHKPLFIHIPATDWVEGPEKDASEKWVRWGIEQSAILSQNLEKLGVDLIVVATGHNWAGQKIPFRPGYQVCCCVVPFDVQSDPPLGPLRCRAQESTSQYDVRSGW